MTIKKKGHNFRELNIWKESMVLVKDVYSLTSKLPDSEKFGLISQINRCAVSIPSNIAEGSGRTTDKDFGRFLSIGLSSSYEHETQIILVNTLFDADITEVLNKITEVQNKIGAFKRNILD